MSGLSVVSDTTPIICLLKAAQLDLLEAMFAKVFIPTAVYDELVSNPRFSTEAKKILSSEFICKTSVHDAQTVQHLMQAEKLDKGESEAIAYVCQIGAELLLMDEAKGRQVAKRMGLNVMGTLGILLAAHKEGKVQRDDVLACLEAMRSAGIRISDTLYKYTISKLDVT